MDSHFYLRALKSYQDSLRTVSNHLRYSSKEEDDIDEKIIEDKLFADEELIKCKEQIKQLCKLTKSNCKPIIPMYYDHLVDSDPEAYQTSVSEVIEQLPNRKRAACISAQNSKIRKSRAAACH